MSSTTKNEELYLEQVTKVWTCFKSFATIEKRELFADFCNNITITKQNVLNDSAMKQILNNRALLEYIGSDNIGYLINFITIITRIKSVALKDKIMELIEEMVK